MVFVTRARFDALSRGLDSCQPSDRRLDRVLAESQNHQQRLQEQLGQQLGQQLSHALSSALTNRMDKVLREELKKTVPQSKKTRKINRLSFLLTPEPQSVSVKYSLNAVNGTFLTLYIFKTQLFYTETPQDLFTSFKNFIFKEKKHFCLILLHLAFVLLLLDASSVCYIYLLSCLTL